MPVRIRLKRMGSTHRPFYRVVVAPSASPRDGRTIEDIGYYDPLTEPATIKVNEEKAVLWLQRGAQPSDTAGQILKRTGILDRFEEAKKAAKAKAAGEG